MIDVSKIFMKMNSVYKQASIERQSIKKRASNNKPMIENSLMRGAHIERLFIQ